MSLLESIGLEEIKSYGMNGVAPAVVTNNQDPEGLGRVKIRFPWLSDDNETDWVRVATLMAGTERGSFFLPDVGDEVLVAFEHGDINAPYVIGMLWNGKQKPPEKNQDGKNNIRKIRSRSGHEIVFNDDEAAGKEKVEIHTKAGHKILLDDTAGGERIEIVDKTGSNKLTIDSVRNSITMECGMQLKIKAQTVEIEGTASLTLKSSAMLTIQG
ncbi:MAG: phage tail protein, partial [Nitrospirae bacterium]|nr:phage tail protein [Nitrospirota bacterium]